MGILVPFAFCIAALLLPFDFQLSDYIMMQSIPIPENAMNFTPIEAVKHTLPNGIPVIAIPMDGRRSVTLGVWVLCGSANERKKYMGASHFLEHMVFKGSEKYGAREIVSEIEHRGGAIDAYTAREETCYYCTLLGEDMEIAFEVLSDLVCHPRLRNEDVELERRVILSEMDEVWDDPASLAQDIFPLLLFGNTPLGRPILGSHGSVEKLSPEQIGNFWKTHYSSCNIIVGAAGAIAHDKLLDSAARLVKPPSCKPIAAVEPPAPAYDGKFIVVKHPAQQAHCILGVRTFPYRDEKRYALALLDTILGRSSASRLFQRIREELGIAYNIQSFSEHYKCDGFWGVYAGTAIQNSPMLFSELMSELRKVASEKALESELLNAKNFLRGRLLISLESPWNLLARAIEGEVHLGKFVPFEETVERLMAITAEQIRDLAQELFINSKIVAMVLGEVPDSMLPNTELDMIRLNAHDIMPK